MAPSRWESSPDSILSARAAESEPPRRRPEACKYASGQGKCGTPNGIRTRVATLRGR